MSDAKPKPKPYTLLKQGRTHRFVLPSGNLMQAGCKHNTRPVACGGCFAAMVVTLQEVLDAWKHEVDQGDGLPESDGDLYRRARALVGGGPAAP